MLLSLLRDVARKKLSPSDALEKLKILPYEELPYATIDHHRGLRQGFPEVILCEGKTKEHVVGIARRIVDTGGELLATRVSEDVAQALLKEIQGTRYNDQARTVVCRKRRLSSKRLVAVVTAGTSDIPVAEEAAETAEALGSKVERIYDVGVAGIHRVVDKVQVLRKAGAIVVAAGMEGALASVVGGLVDRPVIAVPTSVGYGSSFGGLAALLTMLNSCASGVTVVNIDNGFGAGYAAGLICRGSK
jgi:NCAIR mutase (PurE)-related protein